MKVKVWKLLSLILIAVFALSTAHSVYGLTVIATIPVGTPGTDNPYDYCAAYDSGKGEVFVTNAGSDTVSVISDKTNAVIATVPMRFSPYAIAYDSAKGEIFVANGNAQHDTRHSLGYIRQHQYCGCKHNRWNRSRRHSL